ncbi:MAG TPA: YncE family protein [Candidatus Dependentiae bacterium]|nr:YncE family protein [Candidatus Dependentiae bacterium]HRQ62906.1 YncE family protein [Candidatus Dependentiae bacterium]
MIHNIKSFYFFIFLWLYVPLQIYAAPVNSVIATIPTGVTPAGIALTPDNLFAYVANNNNYSVIDGDTVSVLNLTNNMLECTITSTTFNEPYTITINTAGTIAYVTNSNQTGISIIDIETKTVVGLIDGFDGPSGMVITPDGQTAYVNNYGGPEGVMSGNGTTVDVVDLNTNTIDFSITVSQAPAALAITPDGEYVYVVCYVDGNPGTGVTNVIRTSDNTVIDTIHGFSGPFAIAITPDGKYAYVTNFGSNNFEPIGTTVSVIDTNTNTIIATIDLAIMPAGIAISPDGRFAYATNYNTLYSDYDNFTGLTAGQGTVNIIDIATNMVIPPVIPVGNSPANIAISSTGEFAYVSNYSSNSVSVIALPTFEITAQGCRTQNIFLTQRDLINRLTWSTTGTSLPVSYSIYRDAELTDLVAIIPANRPLQFLDHNRLPNVIYTYYLVGINAAGTTSDPIAITVTQNC